MRYLVWWCLQWMEQSASIITTRPENSKAWQRRAKKTCVVKNNDVKSFEWLQGSAWMAISGSDKAQARAEIRFVRSSSKKNPADCISEEKGDSTFTIHLISGSSGGGVKLTARHFIQSHSHTLISYIRILIVPSPSSNECKCSCGRASAWVRESGMVCVCACACVWVCGCGCELITKKQEET